WARWTGSPARSRRSLGAPCARSRWWQTTPGGCGGGDPAAGGLCGLCAGREERLFPPQRLRPQPAQRLAGTGVIAARLVSLADPDARPIRKGKPRHPTQFGYTLLLAEDERGFICDHQLQQGNPPDAPQLVPAVARVIAVTGRAPGTVVGDRGFGTAANDQAMEALGVKGGGVQRNGTPGKARLALERTRAFRRLRNWRVGIEARISHLK